MVVFRSQSSGDGCSPFFFSGHFGRTGGRAGFNNFHLWHLGVQPLAALTHGLGVGVEFTNCRSIAAGQQTMLNLHDDLSDNLQLTIHKHIQSVCHDPFGGVFNRYDPVIRTALGNFCEDVTNGFESLVT